MYLLGRLVSLFVLGSGTKTNMKTRNLNERIFIVVLI